MKLDKVLDDIVIPYIKKIPFSNYKGEKYFFDNVRDWAKQNSWVFAYSLSLDSVYKKWHDDKVKGFKEFHIPLNMPTFRYAPPSCHFPSKTKYK